MAIKLLRKNGGEITADEDRIALDYGFAGQTGVVKNYGMEMAFFLYPPNYVAIDIGMAVTQGGQVTIDEAYAVPYQIATGATVYWYIIYLKADYLAQTATLETNQSTAAYPSFPISDNLQALPSGTAYIPLYRFKVSSGGVFAIEKVFNFLEFPIDEINRLKDNLLTGSFLPKTAKNGLERIDSPAGLWGYPRYRARDGSVSILTSNNLIVIPVPSDTIYWRVAAPRIIFMTVLYEDYKSFTTNRKAKEGFYRIRWTGEVGNPGPPDSRVKTTTLVTLYLKTDVQCVVPYTLPWALETPALRRSGEMTAKMNSNGDILFTFLSTTDFAGASEYSRNSLYSITLVE